MEFSEERQMEIMVGEEVSVKKWWWGDGNLLSMLEKSK